jgi:lipopolysaccharide exporter
MSETSGLTQKTFRGLRWSYTSTFANAIAQIGLTAVMARLLEPSAFGLIAMAAVILRFGQYFAQMGVGQAIIQKATLTEGEIRAAFTSSVLLGTGFFGIAWLAAPLAGVFFDSYDVVPVLRAMAVTFILTGISVTAVSLLRRELSFRPIALVEIGSYLIGYGIIGITTAATGWGVWALVAAALAQAGISAIFYLIVGWHPVLPTFSWAHYRPLYSYGSRVSGISFLEFIGSNLDTLVIGRVLGSASLGIYNRAFMLVNLPMQNLVTGMSRVLFPAFSRVQDDVGRLASNYLLALKVVAMVFIPIGFGMAAASEQLVLTLLGSQWTAAIPLVPILALVIPLHLMTHFGGIVLEATSRLNTKIVLQGSYLLVLGGLFFGLSGYGLIGFAVAIAIGTIARHAAYVAVTKKQLSVGTGEIVSLYGIPCAWGAAIYSCIWIASLAIEPLDLAAGGKLIIQIGVAATVFVASFSFGYHRRTVATIIERLDGSRKSQKPGSAGSRRYLNAEEKRDYEGVV